MDFDFMNVDGVEAFEIVSDAGTSDSQFLDAEDKDTGITLRAAVVRETQQ